MSWTTSQADVVEAIFKLFEQEQGCDDGGDAEGPT